MRHVLFFGLFALLTACRPEPTLARCPETPPQADPAAHRDPSYTLEDFGLGRLPEGSPSNAAIAMDAVDLTTLRDGSAPWFSALLADAQVLLIGEGHWSVESDRTAAAMVQGAAVHGFRTVSLEVPYSWGREMDRYVHLPDSEAETGRRRLGPFTTGVDQIEFLESVRIHNRNHADESISVHAHDIEHDWTGAVERVIRPYVEAHGMEMQDPSGDPLGWAAALDSRLAALPHRSTSESAEHRHIQAVFGNIRAKLASSAGDGAFFHYYRQQAIVANLTDPARDGPIARRAKTVLWGGAHHMRRDFPLPNGGAFLVEGVFLDRELAATRGRVASLRLETIGYGFEHVAALDVSSCPPTGQTQLILQFQGALQAGAVRPDQSVAVDELGPLQEAVLHSLDARSMRTGVLRRVDWDALGDAEALTHARSWIAAFDHTIYIARSPITTPRCAAVPE